jgi:hypothetical protein
MIRTPPAGTSHWTAPPMQQAGGGRTGAPPSGSEQQLAARQAALSDRAAQLARDVAKNMEAGDAMGERAATGLREALREMGRAASSFQRGDLQAGIAQAPRAQQSMRAAMHGMRAAQFGTLGEALAAAQQGATALTQNQHQVSQATERLEEHIRELGSEPAPKVPPASTPHPRAGRSRRTGV